MALISGKGPVTCPKCGKDWLGTTKCECGWRPDAGAHALRITCSVVGVALIAAGCYFVPHWYEYFPNNAAADEHVVKAEDELRRENANAAIHEFEAALQYNPRRADIHRKFADALFAEDRVSETEKHCREAYKLAPKDQDIVDAYAAVLAVKSNWAESARVLEGFYGADPKETKIKSKLAVAYTNSNQLDKAEKLLKEMIAADPAGGNGPWVALYELYSNRGEKKRGIETLRTALRHMPQDSYLQEELGIALKEDGQKAEAEKALTRATKLEPSLAEKNSELLSSMGAKPGKDREMVIPLKNDGHGYVADVLLNGHLHAKMIVDTGAQSCALSVSMAQKLGLTPMSGKSTVIGGATGYAISRSVVLDSVQVGDAKESLVRAVVMPAASGFDGLLGMTFLNRYQFVMDLKKNVLVLKR